MKNKNKCSFFYILRDILDIYYNLKLKSSVAACVVTNLLNII